MRPFFYYDGHIQCVRTNFIIAATCRLVVLLSYTNSITPSLKKTYQCVFIFIGIIDASLLVDSLTCWLVVLAIRLVEALRESSLVRIDIPKDKQKKKMYFVKIYELKATLTNLGEVKIIVGERNNKRMIHYCITKKVKE